MAPRPNKDSLKPVSFQVGIPAYFTEMDYFPPAKPRHFSQRVYSVLPSWR